MRLLAESVDQFRPIAPKVEPGSGNVDFLVRTQEVLSIFFTQLISFVSGGRRHQVDVQEDNGHEWDPAGHQHQQNGRDVGHTSTGDKGAHREGGEEPV